MSGQWGGPVVDDLRGLCISMVPGMRASLASSRVNQVGAPSRTGRSSTLRTLEAPDEVP